MRQEPGDAPARTPVNLEAIAAEVAAQGVIIALLRLKQLILKYDSDQPRVPAGNPDGGQWTGEGDACASVPSRTKPLKPGGHSYDETRKLVTDNNHSGQSDELITAMIYKESRFDPSAQNPHSTAEGMMGLTDTAIKELQRVYGGYTNVDKYDAAQNIAAATQYLRLRIQRTNGSLVRALAGYGTGTVYANSIINAANALKISCDPIATLRKHLGK